jgi:hypothetical protein
MHVGEEESVGHSTVVARHAAPGAQALQVGGAEDRVHEVGEEVAVEEHGVEGVRRMESSVREGWMAGDGWMNGCCERVGG